MRSPLAVMLALTVAALAGQDRPTFKTATRLIEVEVVVTDGNGKPVTGLTRDDFTITENWKAQQIRIFQPIERAATASTTDRADGASAGASISNHPQPDGTRTVILVDWLNASNESQWHARRHFDKYLLSRPAGEAVALYKLDAGNISVLHDFTTDTEALRRAVGSFTFGSSAAYDLSIQPPPAPGAGALGVWLADPAAAASEFFLERNRAFATFKAFEVISEHLSGLSGRKNLIWISEAFPMPTKGLIAEYYFRQRRAAQALSDAQVALYSIDSRGLVGGINQVAGKASMTSFAQVAGNIETMQFFADETGGRAYAHTNDLARSIRRAIDDTRHSYLLAYEPADTRFDGNFRSIGVKVKGKGLIVRHRHGYRASAPVLEKPKREDALKAVLQRPLSATQIRLSADVEPAADASQFQLRVLVDPSSLTLSRDGERWVGTIDFVVAEVSAAGMATIAVQRTLELSLADEERQRAADKGIRLDFTTTVSSSARELRLVVREPDSGRAGSLIIPASALTRR